MLQFSRGLKKHQIKKSVCLGFHRGLMQQSETPRWKLSSSLKYCQEKYSLPLYLGMGNDPVNSIDPSGGFFGFDDRRNNVSWSGSWRHNWGCRRNGNIR